MLPSASRGSPAPHPGFSFHSYLGLGLMSARLAILGGMEGKPGEWNESSEPSLLSRLEEPFRIGAPDLHCHSSPLGPGLQD